MSDTFRFRSADLWWLAAASPPRPSPLSLTSVAPRGELRDRLHDVPHAGTRGRRRARLSGRPSSCRSWRFSLFNYFFLPPVGTFTIADPQNWVALFAFLAVSLVASNLSAVARARDARGAGAARRAGAPVRSEPRRAAHDRQRRGQADRWPAPSRGASISTTSRSALPHGDGWDVFERRHAGDRARSRSSSGRVRGGAGLASSSTRRRGPTAAIGPCRRTDSRSRSCRCDVGDQADRPARGRRPPDRGRDARRARRRRGHRHRARAVSRRAQGGRARPPERGAEVGAARLARPRSAHAAHRDPRRGEQPRRPSLAAEDRARAERRSILSEVDV